jgi:hypothetical protein
MNQLFTEPNPRADPTAAEDLHKPFISGLPARDGRPAGAGGGM